MFRKSVLKNIFRKTSKLLFYQNVFLPKRELKLDLVEEALKILMYLQESLLGANFFRYSGRSAVYLCNFIKSTPAQFEYMERAVKVICTTSLSKTDGIWRKHSTFSNSSL